MGESAEQPHDAVRVDPEIADLVPLYLQRRRADVERLRKALGEGDLVTAALIGHKLKGSGAIYGFGRISEIGACLERAARRGDGAGIRCELEALSAHLDRVRVVEE